MKDIGTSADYYVLEKEMINDITSYYLRFYCSSKNGNFKETFFPLIEILHNL